MINEFEPLADGDGRTAPELGRQWRRLQALLNSISAAEGEIRNAADSLERTSAR